MLLRCVYKIISLKLKGANKNLTLQMAIKAINNSTSLNRLVPILLVFGAYYKGAKRLQSRSKGMI